MKQGILDELLYYGSILASIVRAGLKFLKPEMCYFRKKKTTGIWTVDYHSISL